MRATRTLAVTGLLAVVLSGCSGTVRAGAAATVGDHRITAAELDAVVARGLADPGAQQTVGADKPAFTRSVLSRLIQHLVLTEAAKRAGVAVDAGTVDRAYEKFAAQLGGEANLKAEALKAGIAGPDLRAAIGDAALRDALGDALTAAVPVPDAVLREAYDSNLAQYDQVRSAHILVKTAAQAQQILAQVQAQPGRFAALAAQFSLDTSNKDQGGDLGYQGKGALEKPFEAAIFAAKPNTFVLAQTSFGFHVIHVIDHKIVTFEQATPELRRNLLGEVRGEALAASLKKVATSLGVHVNPRFGTWDVETEDITATLVCADAISSPSPRPDEAGAEPQPTASPAC